MYHFSEKFLLKTKILPGIHQGCALPAPCDPWHLTFAPAQLKYPSCFIEM